MQPSGTEVYSVPVRAAVHASSRVTTPAEFNQREAGSGSVGMCRKGDLLARNCANILWVCLGSLSSESSTFGGGLFKMVLSGMVSRCCRTAWA